MIHAVMVRVTEGNEIAQLITAARGDLPMRELARRSGLSAAQISRIEAGSVEAPTIETLNRLSRALERDPQLLFVALGRVDDDEAASYLLRALSQLGPSVPPVLEKARHRIEEAHRRVRQLDRERISLLNDWQALAGQHDELKAEVAELQGEIESLRSSEDLNEDEDALEALREEAEEREERLHVVLRDLDAITRRGGELRQRMEKCEASMAAASERRAEFVRRAAGELFSSGATSTERELEALLASVMNLPPGSGKTHLLTQFIAPAAPDEEFMRRLDELVERSARVEVTTDDVRKQLAETITKSFAQTRVELEQAMRHLRNQLVHQTGDADFRKLAAAWNRLTPDRRAKVLDFVEDQRRLSIQDQVEREEVTVIDEAHSFKRRS
jgi:transcriptional regulator with XRE-family HTH domain